MEACALVGPSIAAIAAFLQGHYTVRPRNSKDEWSTVRKYCTHDGDQSAMLNSQLQCCSHAQHQDNLALHIPERLAAVKLQRSLDAGCLSLLS